MPSWNASGVSALPPSAAELRTWGQQGADVTAAEEAALAWQRLLPALQTATGSPLSAMAHNLFQVWHPLERSLHQPCLTTAIRQPSTGRRSHPTITSMLDRLCYSCPL